MKYSKVRSIILFTVLLTLISCGRKPWWADPNITWMKTYGGDVCGDVLLAEDEGFFIAGVTNAPDRGRDIYLIRSDSSHNILWTKTYGGEESDRGNSVILTRDSCLVIAGSTSSAGAEGTDACLLKVDQDGAELWSRTYEGPLDEWIFSVCQTADGGYILIGNSVDPNDIIADAGVAGYGGFNGRSSILLLKTDSEGNKIWSRVYDLGTNVINSKGLPMTDGGFIVIATITYFPDINDDLYLFRVDKDGNQVWTHTLEQGRIAGYDLIRTADDNFLISCCYSDDETNRATGDYLFIKIDPEGNEIWRSSFGDPNMIDYGKVVTETTDGGFVATGNINKDLISREQDIKLVKIDKNGQLLWQNIFETATHNMFATILEHPDGGFVIAGSTIVEDNSFDIFLIRTDRDGYARQ